jgi:PGF-CTERM protein
MRWITIALLLLMIIVPAGAIMNPADVHCSALGYEPVTVADEEGGEWCYCRLPDGETVDSWAFLQGEVATEFGYCAQEGYEMRLVEDPERCGLYLSDTCPVCVLPDGGEVDVIRLMNLTLFAAECGDGACAYDENTGNCPEDCPPGGIDDFCDGREDGVCDPDCVGSGDTDCKYTAEAPGFGAGIAIAGLFAFLLVLRKREK